MAALENRLATQVSEVPMGCRKSFTVTPRTCDRALVLAVTGDVDRLTAPHLEAILVRELKKRPPSLVVDLTAVGFLGVAGVAVLMTAWQQAGDTELRVVTAKRATQRALHLTRTAEYLAAHTSLESAMLNDLLSRS